jgi:hypothetical protein
MRTFMQVVQNAITRDGNAMANVSERNPKCVRNAVDITVMISSLALKRSWPKRTDTHGCVVRGPTDASTGR